MFPTGELPPNRLSSYFWTSRSANAPAERVLEADIDGCPLPKGAPIAMKAGPAGIRTAEP